MRRASLEEMNCSLAQSLEIVGEWWSLMIVRDAFFGVTRFDEFQERLGIARNTLTARLETLVDGGVLERQVYDEGRGRADYVLTDMGKALWPVLTALRQWGDEWVLGADAAPLVAVHRDCGAQTTASMVCGDCGEPLDERNLRLRPGPGADESIIGSLRPKTGPKAR
ncbi:MAG: winged helix-turn-helix transcriptional regulator [Acidimicrobiales bacterium]